QNFQLARARLLVRVADGQSFEPFEMTFEGGAAVAIRFEIALIAREEVAALAGFGVLQRGKRGARLVHHLVGVDDPVLLVAFVEGQAIGNDRHTYEEQQNRQAEQQCQTVGRQHISPDRAGAKAAILDKKPPPPSGFSRSETGIATQACGALQPSARPSLMRRGSSFGTTRPVFEFTYSIGRPSCQTGLAKVPCRRRANRPTAAFVTRPAKDGCFRTGAAC